MLRIHHEGTKAQRSEEEVEAITAVVVDTACKAVESLLAVHVAQLLGCLQLSGHRLGSLIKFNVPTLKEGLKRAVL
jgi:GxxExxY protein